MQLNKSSSSRRRCGARKARRTPRCAARNFIGAGNHGAAAQKTIAAKQFEDYTKKLKDIDAIATPHQP
jgi:hypothetical protein